MNWNGKSTKKDSEDFQNIGLFGMELRLCPLQTDFDLRHAQSALSSADRLRFDSLSSDTRRKQFLAARQALEAINPGLTVNIQYDQGRPHLESGYISLSHGGDHACAAFHPYVPIGVDVEGPRTQLQRIAPKFLHPVELAQIEKFDPIWGLRVAWGAKEAVYKAAGTPGLKFAEDIRIVRWPNSDSHDLFVDSMAVRLKDGRCYSLWVRRIPRPDGEEDCVVIALEQVTLPRIVVTGPESSGKSTLAEDLSVVLGLPCVTEVARAYLAKHPFRGMEDLRAIHRAQREASNRMVERAAKGAMGEENWVIEDTDGLTTWIWAEEKFGEVPDEVIADVLLRRPMLYLLCHPEIPWEPDALRENPWDRDRLFDRHLALLKAHNMAYIVLSGGRAERLAEAVRHVRALGR